ncbi:MAG: branched-chain amino acid ABC transporter substrate-binding protein [Ottowia sp.]|nr:branched-chain amino acid ABC transporter substrate-binding protein [Ottowia sp.]
MKKITVSLLAVLTFALCFCMKCAYAEELKIGFAAPLTGPHAMYGKDMYNGIVLAVEDFNASKTLIGGKPMRVVLLVEDDQADARLGTQIAQKMVDRQVNGMFGHFNSGVAIPASRIYQQAGLPQFSLASAPEYTRQGFKTTFRMLPSDVQQGRVMGNYAVKTLGLKKIALIDDRTAYGQGAADEFERAARAAGAQIVRREFTSDKSYDFKAILSSIKRAKPQGIFYGGMAAQAAPLVKQMRELGIDATLLGTEALRMDSFLKVAGRAAQGTVVVLGGKPLAQMPGGVAFNERHKARFGAPVDVYAPASYDAAMMMFGAMKKANSTEPKAYLPYLFTTQSAGITSKEIGYDQYGDLRDATVTLYKVAEGDWQVLDIVSPMQE